MSFPTAMSGGYGQSPQAADPPVSAPLFPLFADLRGRPVLVVGGGAVAERKTDALLRAGARPRVVAPDLTPALQGWRDDGRIDWTAGVFQPGQLDGVWLVIAATADGAVNRAVAAAAEARQLLANVVDDAELSTFQVPAVVERGLLQVAISSGGGAPMVARHLRRQLETLLDDAWGDLVGLLTRQRERIRQRFPDMGERRRFFERLLAGPLPRLYRQRLPAQAENLFQAALDESVQRAPEGSVALVGAGPGDAGLVTLNALRAMNEADVILHDRLVSDDVLRLARRDATCIEVGKSASGHSVKQDEIHALMLAHARAGKRVVRLKGGDPFVFGRGGEELEFLRAHGIPYEVVPGITAAVACAAYAGIPLTHRDHAQSVRFVTAHCKDSLDTLDWASLAQGHQTLAIYMGVAGLENIRARLIEGGRSPQTPFAIIENGSRREQRVLNGTLADLPETARSHQVRSPALLILGEVAALAQTLHWFGQAPLQAAGTPTHSRNPQAPTLQAA